MPLTTPVENVRTESCFDCNPPSLIQVEGYIIPTNGVLKRPFPHFTVFANSRRSRVACGVQAWETVGLVGVTEVEWTEKTAGLSEYTEGGGLAILTDPGSV